MFYLCFKNVSNIKNVLIFLQELQNKVSLNVFSAFLNLCGKSCGHESGHDDGGVMGGMDGESLVCSSRGPPLCLTINVYESFYV